MIHGYFLPIRAVRWRLADSSEEVPGWTLLSPP